MRTILVLNAKGGSGKTTVATNLAGFFASEGAKVALVDLDPQGSSLDWVACARSGPAENPRAWRAPRKPNPGSAQHRRRDHGCAVPDA